jgi:putative transposase
MFIHAHRQDWPVRLQCSMLGVSSSGYYTFSKRLARADSSTTASALKQEIKKLHVLHHRRLGSRRMRTELAKRNFFVGWYAVRSRMRELGFHEDAQGMFWCTAIEEVSLQKRKRKSLSNNVLTENKA